LKNVIDFIQASKIEKTVLYPQLKCGLKEAGLLQLITQKYVQGSEEVVVLDILQERYGLDEFVYLEHIGEVKRLLELGWLHQKSFTPVKISDAGSLELLNSVVALTSSFLKALEEGSLDIELPDIKPYTDHLEYLQDQFYRIELYQKMSAIRSNIHEHSLGIDRIQSKLEILESRICDRIAQTSEDIVLDKFFKQKKFDAKEEILFLALLREEYSASETSLRDMNTLIDLISLDEYERIKNRSLLEEGSRLVSGGIIDYEEMLNPFGGISRSFFIAEDILQSIIHPQKKKKAIKLKLDMLIKDQDIFELIDPDTTLDDVVLHPKTRATLDTLIQQVDKDVAARLVAWGIKDKKSGMDARIIFYGPPGTGKTLTSYSLSKTLKRQVLSFDCSKILSMYVGESEKNVRRIFDTYYDLIAKSKTEPVLLLNEADQFLSARTSGAGGGAEQMYNQMQNIFLEQIENFKGILIATTNLLENIDTAFSRRFNYKIEFKKPSEVQRVKLWEMLLPKNAEYEKEFSIHELAKYSLTGGQINLIVKNTAYSVAVKEEAVFTLADFTAQIEKEQSGNFDNDRLMGFVK
jgi:SpoVK/Ycf46/Vps4 family AAA+-type ATPase